MEKEIKHIPLEIKTEDINEDGTFSGYGSLSDKTPDSYRDIIAPGAFRETLAMGGRNRTGIPMLWQHSSSKIPGVWKSLEEDNIGLRVVGKLALKTQLGNDIYEIMKLSAELKTFQLGMSIGYDTKEYEMDSENKIRTINRLELWELSLVTFPAKLFAGVDNIKCIEDATTIREMEEGLRKLGHTKKEAQHIIGVIKQSLRDSEAAEKQKEQEGESLRESEIKRIELEAYLEALKDINRENPYDFSGILN